MPGPPRTTEPSNAENDWPALLYDNAHTGGQGIRPAKAPDHVRWHFRMGGSVRSAPVLRAGVLYVTSMAGNLHAIDVEKGSQKWQFQAEDHTPLHPVSVGKQSPLWLRFGQGPCRGLRFRQALVGDSRRGGSLDLAGRPRWRSFFRQRQCPHVAVDVDTGRKRWTQELGGRRIYSTACVAEKHLYLGCGDGKVYCLEAASGKTLWSVPTGNGIDSSPAMSGDAVLIGSEDFFFYALDAATGEVHWKYETGLGISSSAAVFENLVVVGSKDGFLYAFEISTGRLRWKAQASDVVTAPPVIASGLVCLQAGGRPTPSILRPEA